MIQCQKNLWRAEPRSEIDAFFGHIICSEISDHAALHNAIMKMHF